MLKIENDALKMSRVYQNFTHQVRVIFRLFTLLIPMLQILTELVSSFFHMSLSFLRCFGLLVFGVSKCWGSGGWGGFRGLGRIGGKIRNIQFN